MKIKTTQAEACATRARGICAPSCVQGTNGCSTLNGEKFA
jgi:hypothetical protein